MKSDIGSFRSATVCFCVMDEREKKAWLHYLESRKGSNRHNYHRECLKEIERWQHDHPLEKPRILLHACCVICACWPIHFLTSHGFEVTIFFSNSNIWPKAEYQKRLHELKRYLESCRKDKIKLIIDMYDYETFAATVLKNRKNDPEGWISCFRCYTKRMDTAFAYADANHYDFMTTVMTFSRQKDSEKINAIGLALAKKYHHTHWLVSDFKKADGHKKSEEICRQYDLYRQDYCGCSFSYQERHPQTK